MTLYIITAFACIIGIAALFIGIEDFPEIDAMDDGHSHDEHEDFSS